MARFATVDSNNGIVGFTEGQQTYNPAKGDVTHPAPWRSLSCPVVAVPSFDPATQAIVGPTYTVNASDVTEAYSVRSLTTNELQAIKDNAVSAMDVVALTALFNHENRIRALEGKAAVTKAQFITAIKGLL